VQFPTIPTLDRMTKTQKLSAAGLAAAGAGVLAFTGVSGTGTAAGGTHSTAAAQHTSTAVTGTTTAKTAGETSATGTKGETATGTPLAARSPQAIARSMVGSATQFACFSHIVSHESSWNPRAVNPSSGAYGLVQALPGSKMASAGADWRTNPTTQIKWGIHYMDSRYGSPCGAWSFWQAHHWY
jgi:hypothetical protein